MIHIRWHDEELAVRRLVIPTRPQPVGRRVLLTLARRLELEIADETSDPLPGDFWIGCHPAAGWGYADPSVVGWASFLDAPDAVDVLAEYDRGRNRAGIEMPLGV